VVINLSKYIPELLRLVRVVYPDWTDFSTPQFVADEIKYKRDASNFAREQLGRDVLWSLIEQGDTDGFLARLKSVAGKTNLLYMGTPSKGDLALIKRDDIDLSAPFVRRFLSYYMARATRPPVWIRLATF